MKIKEATIFYQRWTAARPAPGASEMQALSAAHSILRHWQRHGGPANATIKAAARTELAHTAPLSAPLPPEAVAEFAEAEAAIWKWLADEA